MTKEQRNLIVDMIKEAVQNDKENHYDDFIITNEYLSVLKEEGWSDIQLFQLIMDAHSLIVTSYHTLGLFHLTMNEYLALDPYRERSPL